MVSEKYATNDERIGTEQRKNWKMKVKCEKNSSKIRVNRSTRDAANQIGLLIDIIDAKWILSDSSQFPEQRKFLDVFKMNYKKMVIKTGCEWKRLHR